MIELLSIVNKLGRGLTDPPSARVCGLEAVRYDIPFKDYAHCIILTQLGVRFAKAGYWIGQLIVITVNCSLTAPFWP